MGVFDSELQTVEERLGPELLEQISGVTGASSYTLGNPKDLSVTADTSRAGCATNAQSLLYH
jgi:hypothetical protein